MRFLEKDNKIQKINENIKTSFDYIIMIYFLRELYHLKAIEVACKFVKSTCPFVNHLIMTYHKHYN